MNILAYAFYLAITYLITFKAGLIFYKNGYLFILNLLSNNVQLTTFINKILLIGYYLLNVGYACITLSYWQTIHTATELVESVIQKTGFIVITLAAVHSFNMFTIYILSKKSLFFHSKI